MTKGLKMATQRNQYSVLMHPPARGKLQVQAAGVPKAAPGEKKQVFGINLPDNEAVSFLILASGSLGSALGFAALQEGVFRIPGF